MLAELEHPRKSRRWRVLVNCFSNRSPGDADMLSLVLGENNSNANIGREGNLSASWTCSLCKAGTHDHDFNFSTPCAICPNGTSSSRGATSCAACEPGRYSTRSLDPKSVRRICTNCTPGLYGTTRGASTRAACRTCPPTTFSAFDGATSCEECGPGNFTESGV